MSPKDMLIKQPDWQFIADRIMKPSYCLDPTTRHRLEAWFRENVEPVNQLLSEAKVVYMHKSNARDPAVNWSVYEKRLDYHTHRAYLIGVEEIEQESAEDVLRDFVSKSIMTGPSWPNDICELCERAKRVLNKGRNDD